MEKYGNQCKSDNSFTKKARLLQSIYRVEIGEKEGVGPTKNSKRLYGNMITGGEVSGKNFLMQETFEYARKRVENRKESETIDEFRLFNNLLSSMPMAFNLFHPLMLLLDEESEKVSSAIKSVFKNIPISNVIEIGLEFIPTPIDKYTKDKSAMDAFIKFVDDNGCKQIIAIETKYTDVLGVNEARNSQEQKQMLLETGLFCSEFEELLSEGKVKLTQIYVKSLGHILGYDENTGRGRTYSSEFSRKFRDENAVFSFEEDKNRKRYYHICVNYIPLVQWFK